MITYEQAVFAKKALMDLMSDPIMVEPLGDIKIVGYGITMLDSDFAVKVLLSKLPLAKNCPCLPHQMGNVRVLVEVVGTIEAQGN